MNTEDPKYQQKSKSIASPEQNYFALFAMRYPVGICAECVLSCRNYGIENNRITKPS